MELSWPRYRTLSENGEIQLSPNSKIARKPKLLNSKIQSS